MKRVLWFEVFIIVTFSVRASDYPGSGWPPPPPTRYSRKSKDSQGSQSSYRHSEWRRMRRRPRPQPNQSHYHFSSTSGSGYDQNDGHYHQDQYRRYQEEDDNQYDTPPPPPPHGRDLLFYRDERMQPQFHPYDKETYLPERFKIPHQAKPNGQRHTRTRQKNQRRRVNKNQRQDIWERDNVRFKSDFIIPYDNLDDWERTAPLNVSTTTQEPLHITDVKVPTAFLRIEYMISFSFLGLMYGLGFLVFFQSLCVTTAKITVWLVYYALLRAGVVQPYTIQDALEQVPPI